MVDAALFDTAPLVHLSVVGGGGRIKHFKTAPDTKAIRKPSFHACQESMVGVNDGFVVRTSVFLLVSKNDMRKSVSVVVACHYVCTYGISFRLYMIS